LKEHIINNIGPEGLERFIMCRPHIISGFLRWTLDPRVSFLNLRTNSSVLLRGSRFLFTHFLFTGGGMPGISCSVRGAEPCIVVLIMLVSMLTVHIMLSWLIGRLIMLTSKLVIMLLRTTY
jgi:hypothetical protein